MHRIVFDRFTKHLHTIQATCNDKPIATISRIFCNNDPTLVSSFGVQWTRPNNEHQYNFTIHCWSRPIPLVLLNVKQTIRDRYSPQSATKRIELKAPKRIDNSLAVQSVYVWDGVQYNLWGRINIYKRWTINNSIAQVLPDLNNTTLDEIHKASENVNDYTLRSVIHRYDVFLDDDYTITGDPAFNTFEVDGWWCANNDGIDCLIDIFSDHTSAKAARRAMMEWIRDVFDPK